jgi:hypothetical protein
MARVGDLACRSPVVLVGAAGVRRPRHGAPRAGPVVSQGARTCRLGCASSSGDVLWWDGGSFRAGLRPVGLRRRRGNVEHVRAVHGPCGRDSRARPGFVGCDGPPRPWVEGLGSVCPRLIWGRRRCSRRLTRTWTPGVRVANTGGDHFRGLVRGVVVLRARGLRPICPCAHVAVREPASERVRNLPGALPVRELARLRHARVRPARRDQRLTRVSRGRHVELGDRGSAAPHARSRTIL